MVFVAKMLKEVNRRVLRTHALSKAWGKSEAAACHQFMASLCIWNANLGIGADLRANFEGCLQNCHGVFFSTFCDNGFVA